MSKRRLIVMSGLPGSGKSTIAERIAQQLQIPIFSVDPIESAIIKSGIPKSFESGLAAYLVAEALASEQLKLGVSVIIDAVNAEEEGKNMWRDLAQRRGLELIILDVFVGDQALHRRRLEARVRNLHGFSEVTWDNIEARQKTLTAWTEPTLRLDATNDIDVNVHEALRYIQARQS
jgi:predicted kinase